MLAPEAGLCGNLWVDRLTLTEKGSSPSFQSSLQLMASLLPCSLNSIRSQVFCSEPDRAEADTLSTFVSATTKVASKTVAVSSWSKQVRIVRSPVAAGGNALKGLLGGGKGNKLTVDLVSKFLSAWLLRAVHAPEA